VTVHRSASNAAFLAAALLLGSGGATLAQSIDPEEGALARNQQQLRQNFDKLNGRVDNIEEKIREIAKSTVSHPELMEIVGPLADYYSHAEGNQKLMLLKRIVDLACQNNRDNCELKRRFAELER
jgi:hypothetical protein